MGKKILQIAMGTIAIIALTSGIAMGLLQLNPVVFPPVGEPTADYDCDDDTLDMYRHFKENGIEAIPIVGNLDITGEEYEQCNHVWLLVGSGPNKIAYDWGTPRFDRQHYEGFKISLDYLLYVVQQDLKNPDLLPIAQDK
jgi:hypothetical protein